jgi:hypothetical protein
MAMWYERCNVKQQLFAHVLELVLVQLFDFPWPNRSSYLLYLKLLMVDGYEQTDWPMQYAPSVAIA